MEGQGGRYPMGIYKEKEIVRAYCGFRRLGIRDLLFGDIINWTPGRTVWWPAANWAEAAAQRAIIAFQRWKYPNSPWIYSTHSIIHLMDGVCWNVTAPRADYLKLEEGKLNPDKVYIVCRYRDFRVETAADRQVVYSGIDLLQGTAYDATQLMAILIQEYLGFPEEDYLHVLDPRRKTVCSPAVRGLWVKLWLEKVGEESRFRRPGGELHVERTPPALMENHGTFEIVGILAGGLCDQP
jgi:hypothetical protein